MYILSLRASVTLQSPSPSPSPSRSPTYTPKRFKNAFSHSQQGGPSILLHKEHRVPYHHRQKPITIPYLINQPPPQPPRKPITSAPTHQNSPESKIETLNMQLTHPRRLSRNSDTVSCQRPAWRREETA